MSDNLVSILKGAVIAAIGAATTYLAEHLSGTDFGSLTPVVVAGLSVATNIVRKWLGL